MKNVCGNCEYHDEFTGACCNGDSEHCADFTSNEDRCQDWEHKSPASNCLKKSRTECENCEDCHTGLEVPK